jgi:uncharacterized protein YjiS (DUF1127 family)
VFCAAITNTVELEGKMSAVPGNSLRRLLHAVSSWRRRCRQRAELRACSNLELNDIGICRCEIERIVRS